MMYHLKFSLTGGASCSAGCSASSHPRRSEVLLFRILLLFRHGCAFFAHRVLLVSAAEKSTDCLPGDQHVLDRRGR